MKLYKGLIALAENSKHTKRSSVAVLMTLHHSDKLEQFELALASVQNQSDICHEIRIYLCCDGPLTDQQSDWLASNDRNFFLCLKNDQNVGLARSLNRLIDKIDDEEFVFRMDGDDISLPNRFSTQISHMKANPALGILGCQVYDIDDDGTVIGNRIFPVAPAECRDAIKMLNPLLHPTLCFRREIFTDPELRYPDAYLTEDLALLITAISKGIAIGNSPEFLFQWRVGTNFFARRRSAKRGLTELKWYSRAIFLQEGVFSLSYLKPVARLLLRLLPCRLQQWIYRSKLRATLVKN